MKSISRRESFVYAAGGLATAALGASTLFPADQKSRYAPHDEEERAEALRADIQYSAFMRHSARERLQIIMETASNRSSNYAQTGVETGCLVLTNMMVGTICDRLGIQHGNAYQYQEKDKKKSGDTQLRHHPLFDYMNTCGVAPFTEENVFRLFAAQWFTGQKPSEQYWGVGLTASLLFAYRHNIVRNSQGGLLPPAFDTKTVPVEHFISGLYWWHLMQTRGFAHSLLSHSLYNHIAMGGNAIVERQIPVTEQTTEEKRNKSRGRHT